MDKINFRVLGSFDYKLLDSIKKLEIENLGQDAAINEWQIPVILRYGRILIAEDSTGTILGVCEMIREWKEKKTAFIHSFYVVEKFRKRQVGKKLLTFALDMLKKEHFLGVELTVDPENAAALNLYRSTGFTVRELRKNEYGKGNDRLLLELQIG